MPNGIFCLHFSDRSISKVMGSCYFLIMPCFSEMCTFNTNSADPDRRRIFPMSFLWDARLKWVKGEVSRE